MKLHERKFDDIIDELWKAEQNKDNLLAAQTVLTADKIKQWVKAIVDNWKNKLELAQERNWDNSILQAETIIDFLIEKFELEI